MANVDAPRDNNHVPALIGTSNADGVSTIPVYVDSATNRLLVSVTGGSGTSSSFGSAFPSTGTAIGVKDSTGTNMVALNADASGYLKVNVAAGSSGNAAASATGSAVPASADYVGLNVGGTLQGAVGFDLDSGAGTEYNQGVSLRFAASGGSTAADTNSGNKSAATLRVVLATDQPQLTNKLLVTPDANSAVNVAQINGVTPLMGNGVSGTGSLRVNIASDNSAVSGMGVGATGSTVPANASYNGGNASTALASAATAGNTVGAMYDKFGRQVVLQTTIRDLIGTQTTTISASTSETTIVTAAASTFNDLLMLVVSNTSASTTTRIDFRDTTAGSVLFSIFSPAGDTRGFNVGGIGIPQTTVNTNWTAQCATSTTDIRIYAVFAKNK